MRNDSLQEQRSPDEMGEILASRGYVLLGEGNFSKVYAKPGEKTVLKVGDNDDDWPAYARVCRANQQNPHFPKIYRIGAMSGFLIARMERLEPINASTFVSDHLPMLAYISLYVTRSMRNRTSHWEYANLLHYFRRAHPGGSVDSGAFEKFITETAMKCPRPLAQALATIKTMTVRGGLEFDFKPENFMQRADGTLVLTDPIWSDHF